MSSSLISRTPGGGVHSVDSFGAAVCVPCASTAVDRSRSCLCLALLLLFRLSHTLGEDADRDGSRYRGDIVQVHLVRGLGEGGACCGTKVSTAVSCVAAGGVGSTCKLVSSINCPLTQREHLPLGGIGFASIAQAVDGVRFLPAVVNDR